MSAEGSKSHSEPQKRRSLEDYKIGEKIGVGAFSKVYSILEKATGHLFAIKAIKKQLISKLDKRELVFRERDVMTKLRGSAFFVQLFCSFQDSENLYFVLSYARRGEILRYINTLRGFNAETTRFYISEVVSALEIMHSLNIIHRDLKPENVLVGEDFHIMLTDFGTAKIIGIKPDEPEPELKRTSTFVGTAQYVSPEMLIDKKICKSSDLWSLGVMMYQMLTNEWPFNGVSEYYIFQKITAVDYKIPELIVESAKDLIQKLIVLDPYQRLGDSHLGGFAALKNHAFFEDVQWEDLLGTTPPAQMTLCKLSMLPGVEPDPH